MTEEKIEAPEQNYGPGNVLRAKREEYEWSIEAVAEALHLSTHSVKAIEGDRYDELPGATYVIGYWRSYARLLGIDIEETIEVNKRNLNIVTSEAAGLDVNRAIKRTPRSGGLGWLFLLLVLGGAGYYSWTQNFWGLLEGYGISGQNVNIAVEQPVEPAPTSEPVTEAPPQVLMPLEEKPVEVTEQPPAQVEVTESSPAESTSEPLNGLIMMGSGTTPPADAAPTGAQTGLVMSSKAVQSAPVTPAEGSPNLLEQQTDPVVAVDAAAPVEIPAALTETAPAEAAQTVASTAVAGDASSMTLTLSKDSWLDIRDKTNKRLLYKTEVAGKTISVSGTPPFYVYIGTPDGVKIQYQGKNVPFETHKSGLFARFKLGEATLESL